MMHPHPPTKWCTPTRTAAMFKLQWGGIESQHVNKSYHLIGVDLENMFYNWIFIQIQWSNPPQAHYELKSFKSGKKSKQEWLKSI